MTPAPVPGGPRARVLLTTASGVLPVLFSGAVGLAWWSTALLVDRAQTPRREDVLLPVFFVLTGVSSLVAGALWRGRRSFSPPMSVVAIVAACLSAPVGDDDGLWIFQIAVLLVWAWALLGLEGLVRSRVRAKSVRPDRRGRRSLAVAVTVLVMVASGGLYARATTGPWGAMTALLRTYPAPSAFSRVPDLEGEGDQRCTSSCTARLTQVLRTGQSLPEACRVLEASLTQWSSVTSVRSEPWIAEDGGCGYVGALRPGEAVPEVQAWISPARDPLRVDVVAVFKCALTC